MVNLGMEGECDEAVYQVLTTFSHCIHFWYKPLMDCYSHESSKQLINNDKVLKYYLHLCIRHISTGMI
jgi:hypothetical protein